MSRLEVVVGGQFGSEAKGHVVQRLTERVQRNSASMPHVIRVAGPNAGHTGYSRDGTRWALRQVPVAAVTQDPVMLGVASGSEVDPDVLIDEIDRLADAGLMRNKMLWVSGEATIITEDNRIAESATLDLHGPQNLVQRIGSTGKGIGAARSDRIWRKALRVQDDNLLVERLNDRGVVIAHHDYAGSMPLDHVIIEGTQGFGLGLHAGFYPQCTSSDCRAQDFIAMAGVAPWRFDVVDVWAVARMYPIRVAGNSGPLKGETTWEALGLPEEFTTVTKKVRRVGMPDWDLVRRAVLANGGSPTVRVALTMVDQMFPAMKDKRMNDEDIDFDARDQLIEYIKYIQSEVVARVAMVTTGPNTASFIADMEL